MSAEYQYNYDTTKNFRLPRYVFDLDNTVIDATHRQRFYYNGKLDVKYWMEHCTREEVMSDKLLPLAEHMKHVYDKGHEVIICTSRVINQNDLDFLKEKGLNYHVMLARSKGDLRGSASMKKHYLSDMMKIHSCHTLFYEDHDEVLKVSNNISGIVPMDSKPMNIIMENCRKH